MNEHQCFVICLIIITIIVAIIVGELLARHLRQLFDVGNVTVTNVNDAMFTNGNTNTVIHIYEVKLAAIAALFGSPATILLCGRGQIENAGNEFH